jgi:hypothetical protein
LNLRHSRAEALLLEAQTLAASVRVILKDIPWGLGSCGPTRVSTKQRSCLGSADPGADQRSLGRVRMPRGWCSTISSGDGLILRARGAWSLRPWRRRWATAVSVRSPRH